MRTVWCAATVALASAGMAAAWAWQAWPLWALATVAAVGTYALMERAML